MKFRKVLLFSFILSITFFTNNVVYGLEGIVNGTDVRIRSGAGTSHGSLASDAINGKKYNLVDGNIHKPTDGTSSSCDGWYKIYYNNQVGYICSDFFNIIHEEEKDNSTPPTTVLSNGDGVVACYEDTTSLPLRNSIGGYTISNLNCGDRVEIIDTDVSSDNSCYSYYKVKKGSKTGYVCGKYITTTSLSKQAVNFYKKNNLDEYNKQLKQAGFPESYLPYLDELHARYPNWKFEPLVTNMDYSTVTSTESKVGVSLIQDSEGYRSTAGGSYNYYNDTWNVLDGNNWYAANYATVNYYMDPRLYLNPHYIFMFEKLTYDANYQSIDQVKNILSSTKLGNYDKNYANYYIEAAKQYNVSPIHLASRTRQEVGTSTSVISGESFSFNKKTYSNLYNPYNIGAYSGADNWKRGLIWANGGEDGTTKSTYYNRPWNTLGKAIIGGAEFIADGYINNNQYTGYLQKFNVQNGQDKVGIHQYMTNVRAPLGEASTTYNNYKSFGIIDKEFVFAIPVYKNMENMYLLPTPGNPNNYLSEIRVNGSIITGFDGALNEYDVYVSGSTTNVSFSAKTVNSNSKISGDLSGTGSSNGNIKLTREKTSVKLTVTAENGSIRIYTVNINKDKVPDKPSDVPPVKPKPPVTDKVDLTGIVKSAKYNINGSYMSGINVNTKASSIINSIKKVNANTDVVVKNKNGKKLNNEMVGTGCVIELSNGDYHMKLTVILYGDVSGDGNINALDLLKIQKHILGIANLSGEYKLAANASHDTNNKIDALDLLKVQKHILGLNTISQ
ncbi:MAG: cadherin-like beta sandwich domain-containing protein [Bacilli bacterium]|nr:cadherin-like beta sandwich domain-containing protein [Bacilli bacterium]